MDDTEQLEQQLLLLFRRARTDFQQVAREVHPVLDPAAYGLLHLVASGEADTVTALAEVLGVGKPTVSRQVAALERLGLLARGAAETDRRGVRLGLTGDGRTRFEAARARHRAAVREQLSSWPAGDVPALVGLLTRLNARPARLSERHLA